MYGQPNGGYHNPRNIDFVTPIIEIISPLLKTKKDIVFFQEFYDDKNIKIEELLNQLGYNIYHNSVLKGKIKSHVVAVTLSDSEWKILPNPDNFELDNKVIEMAIEMDFDNDLRVVSFHNTNEQIKLLIDDYFKKGDHHILLGDFNDAEWINSLNVEKNNYRDLVTNDMITYKPGQTAIDRIFIKREEKFKNRVVFNGVTETYASDHNLITFSMNI